MQVIIGRKHKSRLIFQRFRDQFVFATSEVLADSGIYSSKFLLNSNHRENSAIYFKWFLHTINLMKMFEKEKLINMPMVKIYSVQLQNVNACRGAVRISVHGNTLKGRPHRGSGRAPGHENFRIFAKNSLRKLKNALF